MYTIGIDLGGTNIVASVVDDDYNIIGTSKTPTTLRGVQMKFLTILQMFARKRSKRQALRWRISTA